MEFQTNQSEQAQPVSDNLNAQEEIEPEYSEFAQGILNEIPETDRAVVGKYIKTWDGNVTKKFQSYTDKLKGYEALGEIEYLENLNNWNEMLNNDPVQFMTLLKQAMDEEGIKMSDVSNDKGDRDFSPLPEFEGVPQQFVDRYQNLEKTVNDLNSKFGSFNEEKENERIQIQLDSMMKDLHTTHGKFNDDFVLVQLSRGVSAEDAIKAWNDEIKQYSSPQKAPPNVMHGSGGIPSGQADISKMSKEDKRKMMIEAFQVAGSDSS